MIKFLLRGLLAIAFAVTIVIVSFLTGISFRLWPTWVSDYHLEITPEVLEKLRTLRLEKKFLSDQGRFYPGAPDEADRAEAQAIIDAMISRLILDLSSNPQRSTVLRAFKSMLPAFDRMDSEEREQAGWYCERIMQITGVSSSGELLNVWRYRFPVGWFIKN
jgi:hypothetical protein